MTSWKDIVFNNAKETLDLDLFYSITMSNKNIYYTSHFMDYLISCETLTVVLNEFAFLWNYKFSS